MEFSRLSEGRHPLTDQQMVRHRIATEYKNPDGSTAKAVAPIEPVGTRSSQLSSMNSLTYVVSEIMSCR
jgi:hypothetical protein